jgi:hypothetical protein
MRPASIGRSGALVALAILGPACQVVFGLSDYAPAPAGATSGGPAGAAGYGGASGSGGGATTGGGGAGGATTALPCKCVDGAPEGWGYVHSYPSKLEGCLDGAQPTVLHQGLPGPVTCSACACGALTGASCDGPELDCAFGNTGCQGVSPVSIGDGCNALGLTWGNTASCQLGGEPVANGGSCPATGGAPVATPGWAADLTDCPAKPSDGGACSKGRVCLAPASGAKTCIERAGEWPCPSGWDEPVAALAEGVDTRGCEPCQCQPSVTCSGGSYAFRGADVFCMLPPTATVSSSACVDVTGAHVGTRNPPALSGSCAPSGGQPKGKLEALPITICCLPQ